MPPSPQTVFPRFPARVALLALPWVLGLPGCQGSLRPIQARPPIARIALEAPVLSDANADTDSISQDLLTLHNTIRAEKDLPPLSLSPNLSQAAREHVAGMIEMGKLRHEGTNGSTPADRVKEVGYPYLSVGENVAAGQETIDEVMDGWMESPGHRRNILGDFEELGAARAEDDSGQPYWCVVFATPIPQLDPDEAAASLLKQINTLRSDEGHAPLAPDERLKQIARSHSQAMARAGSLKPPGPSIADRVREADIAYRRLSQSVASGNPGPEEVLDALTESTRQRQNLLGPFDRVGIGYATAEDGRPYWTILLVEGQGGSP